MTKNILWIKIFVYKIIHLFFKPKNRIFEIMDISSSGNTRVLNYDNIPNCTENIILTTYFSSKADPQRNIFVNSDDFEYIRKFYESVVQHNLSAIIFHDHLSDEFLRTYTNYNVTFIKCQILQYSLNDERFYIFKEFIENTGFDKYILCDVNDVTFGKSPFHFIRKNKFYIGRDVSCIVAENGFIQEKFEKLPGHIKSKIPYLFSFMPLVNAGVIGGDRQTISFFVNQCCTAFNIIDNELNNNMAVVNIVFFDNYWRKHSSRFLYKARLLGEMMINTLRKKKYFSGNNFHIGYPFTSHFKKFEKGKDMFIFHK